MNAQPSSPDTVQQIKDRLGIVDVVSGYVKLDRAGASLRARCPFHAEKSASFFVSADRGTFHCFGCNVGGDIFSFVQMIEGVDFKGALKILADRAGVEIVYRSGAHASGERDMSDRLFEVMEAATIYYVSCLDDDARAYLAGRGLDDATIRTWRLGLAGSGWSDLADHLKGKGFTEQELLDAGLAKKNERGSLVDKFRNRIMFPISDTTGRVVAFSGRIFPANPAAAGQVVPNEGGFEPPKYLNSPETLLFHKSKILYGYDKAKLAMRRLDCAVLVEGQMDLLMSHQAGWGNTVAVSGTAFTAEHAQIVKRQTDNIVIALDADAAGIKAAGRAARVCLAGGLNVKVARLPAGSDPADLIKGEGGTDAWRAAIRDASDIITFLLDVLQEHAPQADKFRRSVEVVVLPFLADVRSPIAREQYVREIAQRLGVSEVAVAASAAAVPGTPTTPDHSARTDARQTPPPPHSTDHAQQAFALLLWQESLAQPVIDVAQFARDVEEALGAESYATLRALPEGECEALRWEAERRHGKSVGLAAEATLLVRRLLRQRLEHELDSASRAHDRAELAGDTIEATRLSDLCKVLITRIAQLHKVV